MLRLKTLLVLLHVVVLATAASRNEGSEGFGNFVRIGTAPQVDGHPIDYGAADDRKLAGAVCPCFSAWDLVAEYSFHRDPFCLSGDNGLFGIFTGVSYVYAESYIYWSQSTCSHYFSPSGGNYPGDYQRISHTDLSLEQLEDCRKLIQDQCEESGENEPKFSYTLDPNSLDTRDGGFYTDPNGNALTNGGVDTIAPGEIVAWQHGVWLTQDADTCPGYSRGSVMVQFEKQAQLAKVVIHIQEAKCAGLDSPDRIVIELPSVGSVVGYPQTVSSVDDNSRYLMVTIDFPPDAPVVNGFEISVEALKTVDGEEEAPGRCGHAMTNAKFGISEIEVYGYSANSS